MQVRNFVAPHHNVLFEILVLRLNSINVSKFQSKEWSDFENIQSEIPWSELFSAQFSCYIYI
jgi:hypothetical protein